MNHQCKSDEVTFIAHKTNFKQSHKQSFKQPNNS